VQKKKMTIIKLVRFHHQQTAPEIKIIVIKKSLLSSNK